MLAHALIGGAEFNACHRYHRHFQSGRGHVRLPRSQRGIDFCITAQRRYLELYAKLVREESRQFILRSLGYVVDSSIERQWSVASHNAQFAEGLDLIDQAR